MISLFKTIDSWLLPQAKPNERMHYAPYIWLLYLSIFFTSLVAHHPIENSFLYATIGTIVFLIVYFNAYHTSSQKIKWNILSILVIGSLLAILTPGASVFFVYAGAFCCILGSTKKAFVGLLIITAWIAIFAFYFQQSAFFYVPAVLFSLMIGGINIYQHDFDKHRHELMLSQQEVRHLARVSERERIARDLHDLIGHTFSVITLKAELAGKLLSNDQNKAKTEIKELENISREALKQIREVVTGYRTSDLNTELAHAKHVLETNEIHFKYKFEDSNLEEPELVEEINKELAIILRELVTNILKHSKASKVFSEIQLENNQVTMTLEDDGLGFSNARNFAEKKLDSEPQGFGLKGIKERVNNLQGTVVIESTNGTKITINIPTGIRK